MEDELGLENPKASPAETLRAYRFFSEEPLQGRYTAYFVILELICLLLFVFLPQPDSGMEEIDSAFSETRTVAMLAGAYLAWYRLWSLINRHRRLLRIRLSIWEHELQIYCASRRAVVAAVIAASVALAAWISVIIVRLT